MADEKELKEGGQPLSNGDLKHLTDLLSTVKHGSVTLIIQNGKVVQIEKNE
ncbi:MAG: YezD family protein, partial [Treponema sp.]|nr:YezD family protein [Treponema sp.]